MVYLFDEFEKVDESFIEDSFILLSDDRRKKINRLKSTEKRKQSIMVYLLLRIALADEHDIREAVEFEFSENGKPSLKGYTGIHFNLSHCKAAAACAISNIEIGVDVQHISQISERLARRVLTTEELSEFNSSPDPNGYFCKIWTIKESYLKRLGQGIDTDFQNISAKGIMEKSIYRGNGYYCCVTEADAEIKHIAYERTYDFVLSQRSKEIPI